MYTPERALLYGDPIAREEEPAGPPPDTVDTAELLADDCGRCNAPAGQPCKAPCVPVPDYAEDDDDPYDEDDEDDEDEYWDGPDIDLDLDAFGNAYSDADPGL